MTGEWFFFDINNEDTYPMDWAAVILCSCSNSFTKPIVLYAEYNPTLKCWQTPYYEYKLTHWDKCYYTYIDKVPISYSKIESNDSSAEYFIQYDKLF